MCSLHSSISEAQELRWSGWKEAAEPGEGPKMELFRLLPSLLGDLGLSHTSHDRGLKTEQSSVNMHPNV